LIKIKRALSQAKKLQEREDSPKWEGVGWWGSEICEWQPPVSGFGSGYECPVFTERTTDSDVPSFPAPNKMRNEHKDLRKQNAQLQQENQELRERIARLEKELQQHKSHSSLAGGKLTTFPPV